MSCRAEHAPAPGRPPPAPRPSAPRPPSRRCAPQGGLGTGAGTSLRLPLAHPPSPYFLSVTNPQISKGGAQPSARTLSIRGAPGRAWTLL